jgi:hypothetical protein
MLSTVRTLIVGTLITVLVCATGLGAPKVHTKDAGRTEATSKHVDKGTSKAHKKMAKSKSHAGKKTHQAKKNAHQKGAKKAKKHAGKKQHKVQAVNSQKHTKK